MSRISQEAFKKIAEQILGFLYDSFPLPQSTRQIAGHMVRDNEFTLKVLFFLEKQNLVTRVREGKTGPLQKVIRWKISRLAKERMDKTV